MAGDIVLIGIIVAAFAIGIFLYATVGGASLTVADILRVVTAVFTIGAGLALIIGGFTLFGVLLIIFYTFIGLGSLDRLSDTDIRGKLNG